MPADVRNTADKQFVLLSSDVRHPSLHLKKLRKSGGGELWSARVNLEYRALAVRAPDAFIWFWIGHHEEYDLLVS